nr:MAG TPA: hypothetical protein [Caudoviricetes sp.]
MYANFIRYTTSSKRAKKKPTNFVTSKIRRRMLDKYQYHTC